MAKRSKKTANRRLTRGAGKMSPIVEFGVAFIIVAAFILIAFVAKRY
jgi:hypothetical protein